MAHLKRKEKESKWKYLAYLEAYKIDHFECH